MNKSKPFYLNLQLFADPETEATDGKVNFGDILRKHTAEDGVIDIDKAAAALSSSVGRAFIPRTRYNAKVQEIDALTNEKHDLEDKLTAALQWQDKYTKEHDDFEKFKGETDAKEKLSRVKAAYKALLNDAGIDPKRHDTIIRATSFDDKKLGEDGKLENADDLKKAIETEWADFKVKAETRGANVQTPPPSNNNPGKRTKDEIMAIKDAGERQKSIAENHELFGF